MELAAAVTNAVKFCEDNHILQPFLADHASEVFNMLTTEFNMEDAISIWKEEGREEGLAQGIKSIARKLKVAVDMPIEQIAQISGLSIAEVEKL